MHIDIIDPTRLCYILHIQDPKYFDILPTSIGIAKLLFSHGFQFCSIATSGGTDDISHTGAKAYDVKYTVFEAFEQNFEADRTNALRQAQAETGGWVSFLDYQDISIYLTKGTARIWVMLSADKRILVQVYDFDHSFDMDAVVDQIIASLEKKVEKEIRPCYQLSRPQSPIEEAFEKQFLSFWEK